ncbi:MAG: tetratricopeptide repeat protein, partial [Candidatus Thorarchaeota archaeon]
FPNNLLGRECPSAHRYAPFLSKSKSNILLGPVLGGQVNEAIRLNPKDALAYYNRGLAYYYLGEPQRVIQDLNEAIRLDPKDGKNYNNRGYAYGGLGQWQRACEDFDEAIRLDPQDATAYANRALSYTALGKEREAQQDVDRAVELGVNRDRLEQAVEKALQEW